MATIRKFRGKFNVQIRKKGYPFISKSFTPDHGKKISNLSCLQYHQASLCDKKSPTKND